MRYVLKHKNIDVANIEINDISIEISAVISIDNILHMPFGVDSANIRTLNRWWKKRAIPDSRVGVEDTLDFLGISSLKELLLKNYGLNLSDQYWVCPHGKNINWDEINYFNNDFKDDIGSIMFGKRAFTEKIDDTSPDIATSGYQQKMWIIRDGRRLLLKAGSRPSFQEPYNEVLAGNISKSLNLPFVNYDVEIREDRPFSVCETFITPDTDFVSARQVLSGVKGYDYPNKYEEYIGKCNALGVKDIQTAIDKMIVLDYIIQNEDRHMANFGLIRDAQNLGFISVAPIFDSSNSLYFRSFNEEIARGAETPATGFESSNKKAISHIKDFSFIDFDGLRSVTHEWRKTLKESKHITEERAKVLQDALNKNINELEKIAANQCSS
jgi:hypothetical protein